MKELVETAVALARGAGALLREKYDAVSRVDHKSTLIDLVTDADRAAEEYLLEGIRRRFSNHGILAEESGEQSGSEVRWVVDPLDGTVNFAHRIPHFSVLVAIQSAGADGYRTDAGVTYDPMRDELYVAQRGRGARLGDVPIRVSETTRLIDSSIATGFGYGRLTAQEDNHREFCRINLVSRGVRRFGSAGLDLAYVACGRFDGFWEYRLNPWDLAGGVLLVEEAGGRVTDFGGESPDMDVGTLAASNGAIHGDLLAALASSRTYPINSRAGLEPFLPAELQRLLTIERE